MILKLIFIAIISIFLSSAVKKYNSEIASIINVCGGVLIFLLSINELVVILDEIKELYGFVDFDFEFITFVMKVVGVGYIVEFTADIAEDFGNNVIASKVILGGKIVICGMTVPIVKELLVLLFSFLS